MNTSNIVIHSEILPIDVIYNVLSYIGNTSRSICTGSQNIFKNPAQLKGYMMLDSLLIKPTILSLRWLRQSLNKPITGRCFGSVCPNNKAAPCSDAIIKQNKNVKQCNGITQMGNQCRRNCSYLRYTCYMHRDQINLIIPTSIQLSQPILKLSTKNYIYY